MSRKKPDPYADLGEAYAEETSIARAARKTTPKTPTDSGEDADLPPETGTLPGFHIDGDPRYWERR